jgi:hypothetical protein
MARGVPLLSLVIALLIGAFLWSGQNGGSSTSPNRRVEQARQTASAVTFQQAESALEDFRALNGTYASAPLAGFGVRLARADASSYCIQAGGSHVSGPGGAVTPGPC